ncbi:RING finger protein 17-like [Spodoptera frugiperda]|uniref:RING finger protein 17-like n=1 Tax=Spodoptera frugiperda TaxID=7108 RepID=A0A9R0D3M1_SPOFR|nr:RING finger protein 17-like [Spodoptera frugiperda]
MAEKVTGETVEISSENMTDEILLTKNKMPAGLSVSDQPQPDSTEKNTKESEDVSHEDEDNNNVAKEDASPPFLLDWLPPEPLLCPEFDALITCISDDGMVYLHDVHQQHTRELIRNAINVQYHLNFKGPDPKALLRKWRVGQPCVVLEEVYKSYRGRVIQVNQQDLTCLVHYIDYGYDVTVPFAKLRKSVPLRHIPTQALKCMLNRIRPVGNQWDREALYYLRKSIVEKECSVKVVGDAVDGVLPVELKYDQLWVNDHLVDFEMAKYEDAITKAPVMQYSPDEKNKKKNQENTIECDSPNSSDLSSKEDQESASHGKFVTYPKYSGTKYLCDICEINDANKLPLDIFCEDENIEMLYEYMYRELQSEGMNMPPLNGIFENKPCIVLCPEDSRWYRASILHFSKRESLVKIKYADHCDIEFIPLAHIREISEKWLNLPPANVTAKLFGLRVNREIDISDLAKRYAAIFLETGPYVVTIMGYEGLIPLVELRFGNRDLVYQKLIDDNILIKCN